MCQAEVEWHHFNPIIRFFCIMKVSPLENRNNLKQTDTVSLVMFTLVHVLVCVCLCVCVTGGSCGVC